MSQIIAGETEAGVKVPLLVDDEGKLVTAGGGGGAVSDLPSYKFVAGGNTGVTLGGSWITAGSVSAFRPMSDTEGTYFDSMLATRFLKNSTGSNLGYGLLSEHSVFIRGNSTKGGYKFVTRFGSTLFPEYNRLWVGMIPNSNPTNDLATFNNTIGFDLYAGLGGMPDFKYSSRSGTGTTTVVETGITYALNKLYEVTIETADDGLSITTTLTDLEAGTTFTHTETENLPAAFTRANCGVRASNKNNTSPTNLDVVVQFINTQVKH